MELKPIVPVEGRFKIYALKTGPSCLAEEFLAEQAAAMPDEVAKLMSLLNHVVHNGPPKNDEKCKTLGNKIFEFKTKKLRLCWFWDVGYLVICSHGWVKKANQTPPGEIDRAIAAHAAYLVAKAKNEIKTLPFDK